MDDVHIEQTDPRKIDLALFALAGNNGFTSVAAAEGRYFVVEPEAVLLLFAAVALEAVRFKDRANGLGEIDLRQLSESAAREA